MALIFLVIIKLLLIHFYHTSVFLFPASRGWRKIEYSTIGTSHPGTGSTQHMDTGQDTCWKEARFLGKSRTRACEPQLCTPLSLRLGTHRGAWRTSKGAASMCCATGTTRSTSPGPGTRAQRAGRTGKRQRPVPMAPHPSRALGEALRQEAMSYAAPGFLVRH